MIDLSPILSIETSDSICGTCIYFNEEKYFTSKINLRHSHSEKIFEIIDEVNKQASIKNKDIKSIAISSGPGSFTGLRIGIAAAKGLSQSLGIPIISVPTFDALALQITQYLPEQSEFCIVNKVGKDEVYFAKFFIKSNNYIFSEELKIIPYSELNNLENDIKIFGNVDILSQDLTRISSPDPEYVAKWASRFGKPVDATDIDFIEPNYIKEFVVKEKKI